VIIDRLDDISDEIIWEIRVPIFKNGLILRQLSIAIGIPFGILMIILLLAKAYYGLILVGATLILAVLLVSLIYRGSYDVRYVLNRKGILCQNQERQKKRVKRLSAVTFLLGLFSRNFPAAGAGLLSGSRMDTRISWKRIKKIKFKESHKTITVYAGIGENIALFCTDDNYDIVKQYIKTAK